MRRFTIIIMFVIFVTIYACSDIKNAPKVIEADAACLACGFITISGNAQQGYEIRFTDASGKVHDVRGIHQLAVADLPASKLCGEHKTDDDVVPEKDDAIEGCKQARATGTSMKWTDEKRKYEINPVCASGTSEVVNHPIFIAGAGALGANYMGTVTSISGDANLTMSPATQISVSAGAQVYDPCQVTMSTALQPPGTYYGVAVWPSKVKTSTFTFHAVDAIYDWSTVVPTPTISPAQNLANVFSRQIIGGNVIFSGAITFSGTINCSFFNEMRCISPSNPQGWAGSDAGAWLNSAQANCQGQGNNTCGVHIAAGAYSFATPIVPVSGVTIEGAGSLSTILIWTGSSSGKAINAPVGLNEFKLRHLSLTTTVGGTSIAIYLPAVFQTTIDDVLFNGVSATQGFGTHIWVTGDGNTGSSNGVYIYNCIFQYPLIASVAADHVSNLVLENNTISPFGSTTGSSVVLDSGVSGLFAWNLNTFNGVHGLWLKCTGVNSVAGTCAPNYTSGSTPAYNSPPWGILIDQGTFDSNGSEAILFDSTLGPNVVDVTCSNCWIGSPNGTVPGSGLRISGGHKISWVGGSRIRGAWQNGILIDSANAGDVLISDSWITNNNVSNNPDAHGVYITAAAAHVRLENDRIGNPTEPYSAGFQKYGVKVTANAPYFSLGNSDLNNNVTGPYLSTNTAQQNITGNFPITMPTFQGGVPTCAFTSGGGTGPSCTFDTGSSDAGGIIIATTGTGSSGLTGTITLTFSTNFGVNAPSCTYMANNGGAGQWGALAQFIDRTPTNTKDLFTWTNATGATPAGVALSISTAYWISYRCWAK